ncbi:MAG: pyridoxamine 5'-phosphate oxidase family protein [Nocardioidaceae bacterium]
MTSTEPGPLSPTERSTPRRERERAATDRAALHDVLAHALVGHLAVVVDGVPLALPTVFAVDPDGPDRDGTLYLHGSVASRSLVQAPTQDVSMTFTLLDGLVLARSGFNHSMNYRSAVVVGRPRLVSDPEERAHALDLIVDHVVPGRSATLRRPTRKELAATAVLALPLHEASVKSRAGDPEDEPEDVAAGVWAGVVPLATTASAPVTSADSAGLPVPAEVTARVAGPGA